MRCVDLDFSHLQMPQDDRRIHMKTLKIKTWLLICFWLLVMFDVAYLHFLYTIDLYNDAIMASEACKETEVPGAIMNYWYGKDEYIVRAWMLKLAAIFPFIVTAIVGVLGFFHKKQ